MQTKPQIEAHPEPRIRAPLIIAVCTTALIGFGLIAAAIEFHALAMRRPMQSMRSLGLLVAPDTKPLARFPQPGVDLDDDHGQMTTLRTGQLDRLNSYGWIDRSNGVIRVPIDRAMELLLQRGLPVATAVARNAPLQFAQERKQP